MRKDAQLLQAAEDMYFYFLRYKAHLQIQQSHRNNVCYAVYTSDGSLVPRLFGGSPKGGPKEPGYEASLMAIRMSQHPKAFHHPKRNYVMLRYITLHYDHFAIACRVIVAEA